MENITKSPAFLKTCQVLKTIGHWIYLLRKVFMAIPVVYAALRLALYSLDTLPAQVGLNIQATGEFAQLIDRNVAVYGPLALTFLCLVLMFCSRKTLYPWLISIFSLALPGLILLTNLFHG